MPNTTADRTPFRLALIQMGLPVLANRMHVVVMFAMNARTAVYATRGVIECSKLVSLPLPLWGWALPTPLYDFFMDQCPAIRKLTN